MQGRRSQEVVREIPEEVRQFEPGVPVVLDRATFMKSLQTARRGSSPGPGGWTYEHLKIMLEDTDIFDMLFEAASSFAQARIPEEVKAPLMSARLTALAKEDGGVRGIATGSTLRRLVARTLARQFAEEFEEECAPFQYALSTRAGTDCVGHMLRAATDHDHRGTILKVDGIGAYDHILRSAMWMRLVQMPRARSLAPFVKMSYVAPSTYSWFDDEGQRHTVTQAEGGEQGDPLMPLLFSIGIQGALEDVADAMRPDEQICAFLDDVYIVCQPERVRVLYDRLAESLIRVAGTHLREGKTRVWNASGTVPGNVVELGPDVWQPRGITVLGTHPSVQLITRRKRLKGGWQHTIRTLPPARAEGYAHAHDEGIWSTARRILADLPGSEAERDRARLLASLPMRMGGLGLRSAVRCSRAAYWASWADALPMIHKRNPAVADMVELAMVDNVFPEEGCLSELARATDHLDREGSLSDQVGRNSAGAGGLPRVHRRNQVSGNTAGSVGLLPLQTNTSGRSPCCQARLPPTGRTFDPTLGATQV